MKTRACEEVGLRAQQFDLPESTTTEELLDLVGRLNADPAVNGVLVQLPLPSHCDSERVLAALDPLKDVDGLTQFSAGALFIHGVSAPLIPCTPLGCLALLDAYHIPIEGRHVLVLGRSNLVGKPIALLLLSRHATVTIAHSRTINIHEEVARADIVVAAIGKAEWVKGEWLKPGAVVVDVGINSKVDPSKKAGYRLVGDVDFDSAKGKVSAITPVPGGVGPMTVAMLIKNTVRAYRMQGEKAGKGGGAVSSVAGGG
jgi:5,10-methylene-tetrahydrofolate dehydrogenase/methenyl tetrahydrofolate cyclohydrolase